MISSLEGWPTKAKEAPPPHEVRLAQLETNLVIHQHSKSALGHKIHTHIFTYKCSCNPNAKTDKINVFSQRIHYISPTSHSIISK